MLRPSQELIDQSSPLVGTRVGQECGSFVYRRKDPDDVEINPSQKYIVGAQRGWIELQLLELRIDQVIDEIQLRLWGPLETGCLFAEEERYRLDMLEESDQNHRLSFLMCGDLSANIDAGHAGVRAFVDTKIRHIPA